MDNNIKLIIELLLKNKSELDKVIASLSEKHGIDIDTSDADSAMADLQASVEGISDTETVIDADATGAVDAANEAESEIEEIPEEHETEISAEDNTTSVITAISTGYMALMQVIGQVKGKIEELVNLSGEQEKSEKLLQVSLANTGDASQATFEKFKDLAASYQNVTTIGDETTMTVMRLGLNMGVMTEDLEEAAKGAIALSKSLDLDLKTAMKMHTLAMEGDYTMLQRYLPALKTAKDDAEKMAIVKKAEADGWRLATAETETGYGALEQYGNIAGDVKEKIGDLVMFAMTPLLKSTQEWLLTLDEALKKPLSDKLREERIEFAALINILKNGNTHQATRNQAIKTLQEKYPDYIKNIDLEKASIEELGKVLKIANDKFQQKINMQAAEEILTKAKEKSVRETKKLIELEIKLEKLREDTEHRTFDYNDVVGELTFNIKNQTEKVNKLDEEYGELFTRLTNQGLITEETTQKITKQTESVKGLSEELQALYDASKPKIKIEYDDELEDIGDDDENLFEREMARQSELLALKGDFAQRGYDLNTSIYEQQLDAVDEFYERKKEDLIAAGLTEQEIVAQSEQAKQIIRDQYNARAIRGTAQALGNLAKAFRSQGKKGFKTAQNLAIAETWANTYTAAMAAYKSLAGIPFIGPGLGIAAAAAAVLAGKANVKKIKSQKFSASKGTVLQGPKHSQGGIPLGMDIEAEGGEPILTAGVSEDPVLLAIASAINEAAGGDPLPGRKKGRMAGGGVVSSSGGDVIAAINNLGLLIMENRPVVNITVETTDPEAKIRQDTETKNRMTGSGDAITDI